MSSNSSFSTSFNETDISDRDDSHCSQCTCETKSIASNYSYVGIPSTIDEEMSGVVSQAFNATYRAGTHAVCASGAAGVKTISSNVGAQQTGNTNIILTSSHTYCQPVLTRFHRGRRTHIYAVNSPSPDYSTTTKPLLDNAMPRHHGMNQQASLDLDLECQCQRCPTCHRCIASKRRRELSEDVDYLTLRAIIAFMLAALIISVIIYLADWL
jgi:hypothetical protein